LGAGALSGFEKGSETPDRKGAIGEKKVTLGHVSPKRSVLRPYYPLPELMLIVNNLR
jgi:hypothetical protein